MEKQDYHCRIQADVSPREAIREINRVSAWWAKNLEGHTEKLHDIFTVRFGETMVEFQVVEMIPGKRIVWYVRDCYLHWLSDKKEWKDTRVVWEISGTEHSTIVDFTHVGLVPGITCYKDCVKGWNEHVKGSLYKLMMEKKGMPA